MTVNRVTCGNCGGSGIETLYKDVFTEDKYTGQISVETVTCTNCGGKGYIERAEFSVDEAKAILEHCGLEVEL
jgi:DnaJ-class molecular chaperone